jgi:Rieske Fe-S protein
MSSHTESSAETKSASCDGCALVPRRDFLRDATLAAAAALAALGAAPAIVAASPTKFVTPVGGEREEKAYPIPSADGVHIDKANDAIVTRWEGKVYVYSLACPHQNTTIKWSEKDRAFECPKHHSRFTPDGIYIKDSGRATRGLDRLAVRKDGNTVVANLDKAFEEDEQPAEWKAAFVTV